MNLHILHTNDIHSRINDLPKLGYYINEVRKSGANTLLVDSGDMITGDFQFKFNQGKAEQHISNYLKYDFVTVGNHDFDLGVPFLKNHMRGINAPYVISNVIDKHQTLDEFYPYIIKKFEAITIGIIGYSIQSLINTIAEDNQFEFVDRDDYQKQIDALRDQGVDLIIAINHLGIEGDRKLSADFQGIDLIISAHTHTRLEEPEINGQTMIVQTGSFGSRIGHLNLEIVDRKIKSYNYKLVEASDIDAVDSDLQEITDAYLSIADKQDREVFGSCAHDLDGSREQMIKGSTNLGTLVCNSYLHYGKLRGYNPDFAFINARGLRQGIPAGDITTRSLYNVMPFEKKLVVVDIKGQDLLDALDNHIELQSANLVIDIAADGSKRFYDRSYGNELDPNRIYQIITVDYVYEYSSFSNLHKGRVIERDVAIDTDVVSSYIKTLGENFEYKSNNMVRNDQV